MAYSFLQLPAVSKVVRLYRERLTCRGQYLLWSMVVLAILGLDTRRTLVFWLFAMVAGLFAAAAAFTVIRRPRVHFDCRFPERATASRPVTVHARVSNAPAPVPSDLCLLFRQPPEGTGEISFHPTSVLLEEDEGTLAQACVEMRPARRGRYVVPGPVLGRTDPLRLMVSRGLDLPEHPLLVYPRFYSMHEFIVPLGRRHQPGGIPLTSSTGEAIEFVGTREYRPGDPVKNIHWRSWARRGEPVVKEYMEEYFCRIAIVLDTFLPSKFTPAQHASFEAAISVVASIADYFSRSEDIVDILAAGPDVYEVSAGRSLAYLENILDVLACLGPCHDPPFATIGPNLFEKLSQITTVVAVLQDWDTPREDFLKRVHALGTAVRAIIVHDGSTQKTWEQASENLGEVSVLSTADVERLLAAEYPHA
ncbi:MAG: hypothetical protein DMG82_04620 [Acidobacteria bacterium]|nr:MAG: hypothetical protein DMG82_04620 [Acidobacteriota bacterium]